MIGPCVSSIKCLETPVYKSQFTSPFGLSPHPTSNVLKLKLPAPLKSLYPSYTISHFTLFTLTGEPSSCSDSPRQTKNNILLYISFLIPVLSSFNTSQTQLKKTSVQNQRHLHNSIHLTSIQILELYTISVLEAALLAKQPQTVGYRARLTVSIRH